MVKRNMELVLVLGACLLAAAALGCWAFLGSGFRVMSPTLHSVLASELLVHPASRQQTSRFLQRQGYVSLLEARTMLVDEGGTIDVRGDPLAATLAVSAGLLAAAARLLAQREARRGDRRLQGLLSSAVRQSSLDDPARR